MEAALELTPVRRLKPSVEERLEAVRIECVGVRPLLLDSTESEEVEVVRRRRKPQLTGPPPKGYRPVPLVEVCAPKLYRGPNGELGFPGDLLQACLVAGGRHLKLVRRQLTDKYGSQIPGVVTVRDEFIAFASDIGWKPDKRKGKDGIMLKRPRFDVWRFACTLDIRLGALEGLTFEHIEELVRLAGRREGIGCFRHSEFKLYPDQDWQPAVFGAFQLTRFEKI
ncbi:MAG: hypothetical protein WC641_02580 [Patescibacteria group bacterium]